MRKDDAKTLDALALAALPEHALIARLANKYVDRPFDMEQCRAVIRATYPDRGQLGRLSNLLWDERARQELVRHDRKPYKDAAELERRPYAVLLNLPYRGKNDERARHGRLQFDAFMKAAFDGEILALMELTSQDCRSYRVAVLDCRARPAISAIIKVTVEGDKGAFEQRFLLYKVPGTSKTMAAFTEQADVKGAWSMQLPPTFVGIAGELKRQGYTFRTDFDKQAMVVTDPETGRERLTYWTGRANGDDD